ncbi:MAG: 1-acyl-sn-glycerol-3-phosphate acyltransferase [Enterobacterales bacterium]|jgi:1-acyl-sn-glycerol-3-phosphate acyltransferase
MLKICRYFFAFLYLIFITGFVGLLISIIRPFNANNVWSTTHLMGHPMRIIMGLKYVARNIENIEVCKPCVYISNHQNVIDIVSGSIILPRRTVSLGKSTIVWIPIFGLFYWLSGNILINRSDKKKVKQSMTKVTNAIRNNNTSVWIMPEGTRNLGKGLLPFKTGAFKTAITAGVPIVPICFNTYARTADFNKFSAGTIACQVLKPIPTVGLSNSDANKLAKQCFNLMDETINKLDQEFL